MLFAVNFGDQTEAVLLGDAADCRVAGGEAQDLAEEGAQWGLAVFCEGDRG